MLLWDMIKDKNLCSLFAYLSMKDYITVCELNGGIIMKTMLLTP